MKKTVLALSLMMGICSASSAFAALPQSIRIGTDATYAPFLLRMRKGISWVLTLIWAMSSVRVSK
jgi:lysine/arginine/ornithine transport system substrate-binding protein